MDRKEKRRGGERKKNGKVMERIQNRKVRKEVEERKEVPKLSTCCTVAFHVQSEPECGFARFAKEVCVMCVSFICRLVREDGPHREIKRFPLMYNML